MRNSQAPVQVLDVPLLLPPKKTEPGEACPECGGPAEVDLFWSTSPDNPGVKFLKKQTCCGGRRGRPSRFRMTPTGFCPVRVEILDSQPACQPVAVIREEPTAALLDATIDLLARFDETERAVLRHMARLTRQLRERKAALKARLASLQSA